MPQSTHTHAHAVKTINREATWGVGRKEGRKVVTSLCSTHATCFLIRMEATSDSTFLNAGVTPTCYYL